MDPNTVVIAGLVGLLALTKKFIDFARLVSNLPETLSGTVTQLAAWIAATVAVFLYGASQFGATVAIDGITLSDMTGWTKLLVGLAIGSAASLVKDFVAAADNTDSSTVPPLIPPG